MVTSIKSYILILSKNLKKNKILLSSRIVNSSLGNNLSIGSSNTIRNSNIRDFIRISDANKIDDCVFEGKNRIGDDNILFSLRMGEYSYIGSRCLISESVIGRFCSLASNIQILPGKHPVKMISTYPAFYSRQKAIPVSFSDNDYFKEINNIEIGNDVWIGNSVTILDGVKIQNGAILAAGAVVTENIPPYAIAGGVPAKVIRYRFTEATIDILDKIKWWNWPEEKLKSFSPNFRNDKEEDILRFLKSL
ncbi:MAG: antibiotic acetyltransferase [Bacteroidales bacterium]|jgi:acetyltransferase-like isoleucine patch superfamily enzyme